MNTALQAILHIDRTQPLQINTMIYCVGDEANDILIVLLSRRETWACETLADYFIEKQFHIETDRKPLVLILGSKNQQEMSLRIQRLRMRLLRFDFTVSHGSGKILITADTLFRAPEPHGENLHI